MRLFSSRQGNRGLVEKEPGFQFRFVLYHSYQNYPTRAPEPLVCGLRHPSPTKTATYNPRPFGSQVTPVVIPPLQRQCLDNDMDDLFEKLRVLWEWARFYPTPAKFLFAVTAILLLASGITLLFCRPGAAVAKAAYEFNDAIPVWVGVDASVPPVKVPEENGIPEERAVRYRRTQNGNLVTITPSLPYLDRWQSGKEVDALNIGSTMFRWRYPSLDIQFSNNSDKILILSAIGIDVRDSKPVNFPRILVVSDFSHLMSFRVCSAAPTELTNCTIDYNLADPKESKAPQPYVFHTTLPTLSGRDDVPVYDALASAGAEPSVLRLDPAAVYSAFQSRLPIPALGPFKQGTTQIRGQLHVTCGNETLGPFKFVAEVALVFPGPQALLPPTITYDVELQPSGSNYHVDVPVPQPLSVAPGGAEHFQIRLGVPQSSEHEFFLKLDFHDGRSKSVGPIRVQIVRPD